MALAILAALTLAVAEPAPAAAAAPASAQAPSQAPSQASGEAAQTPSREQIEDALPDGAPADDYEFVAWCHGALAGQIELDPIVEKDMDAIEGPAEAAKRKADDAAIAAQHAAYLKAYEAALAAAEKASPTAIHPKGVAAELLGYRIWGATRNKAPIWRMVDWGNWEVPPRCQKAAKRLYDRATLFGAALKGDGPPPDTAPAPDPAAPDKPPKAAAPPDPAAAGASPKPPGAGPAT